MQAETADNMPSILNFRLILFDPTALSVKDRELHDRCVELCRIGDTSGLLKFFNDNSIFPGSEPLYLYDKRSKEAPWIPNVLDLLANAAQYRHKDTIVLILRIYPGVQLYQSSPVVQAAVRGGSLEILELLQAHDPEFAPQAEMVTSALIYSLKSPDPRVPKFFLDNGADVNNGPPFPGIGSALYYAAVCDETKDKDTAKVSLDVIVMLIKAGARIDSTLLHGLIREERTDVIELLARYVEDLCFGQDFLEEEESVKEHAKTESKGGAVLAVDRLYEKAWARVRVLAKQEGYEEDNADDQNAMERIASQLFVKARKSRLEKAYESKVVDEDEPSDNS
jgi:hypothetical protein